MENYAKIMDGVCVNIAVFEERQSLLTLVIRYYCLMGMVLAVCMMEKVGAMAPGGAEPPPEPESKPDVMDELAAAIREGVNEV